MVYDLSYDPRDPLFDVPGMPGARWGIQIFTTRNLYGLAPEQIEITETTDGARLACRGLSWAGQQQRAPGRVEATVACANGATEWAIEAWADEPIKSIKLVLWGLPESAGGGWWQAVTPAGASEQPTEAQPLWWRYPWPTWLTPWACAGEGPGAVCVSVRDPEVRAKRLYAHRPPYSGGQPVVEIVCDEDAGRWDGTFTAPPIRLRIAAAHGDIEADFEDHLAFLERAYGLAPWEQRRDVPDWMRRVRLVLNLHGQHWTGYVFNTFDRMAEALRAVTQHIPGDRVLAYVPGWEGRYYYAYPFYRPGEAMGGEAGFRRLRAVAHELGVHLMPMFGMHGANAQLYPGWEQAAFRNRTNRYVELINRPDWDGDRSGEDDQLFLNPGEPGFRQHLTDQISRAIEDFDLEGVFLDTSACWFNDPRHNLYEGYRALLGSLRARYPHVLFAGEGWWDALLGVLPVNQSWLGVTTQFRFPQLLTRYARALGHLMDGTPGWGSTGVHERGYLPPAPSVPTPGHIPCLGIVEDTLEQHAEDMARICRAANRL